MEGKLHKINLYETYKSMLTLKMQDIFEQYYFSDLSLREIGENNNISFQAVRDTLKKVEKTLEELEEKLGLQKLKKELKEISDYASGDNVDLEILKEKIYKLGE